MRTRLAILALPLMLLPAAATQTAAQTAERYYDCALENGTRIGFAVNPAERTMRRPEGPERRAIEYSDTRITALLREERIEFDPGSNAVIVTPIVGHNGFRLPEYKNQSTGTCTTAAAWGPAPSYRQALSEPVDNVVTLTELSGDDAELPVLGEGPAAGGRDGVIVRSVNLRAGPDRGAPTIRVLPSGSRVAVVSCDGWCRIQAGGSEGWVYRDFISTGR